MEFNHISSNKFPGIPETLEPVNNFDYERWGDYETTITLCNVPWGTSEVQVGLRSIGGLGKVVKFPTDADRDNYFDMLPNKVQFTTPYRGFSQDSFQLKIPFDMALGYNYLYVEYNPATANDALIDYEGVNGIKRIYYFIRDIKYRSPNNTEFICLLDHWTTFINSVPFVALGVERGHIATAQTTVSEYLANPIANNEFLLHEDITGTNAAKRASGFKTVIFNDGTQYALIASTCNIKSTYENAKNGIRCTNLNATETPSYYLCCVLARDIRDFIGLLNANAPEILATIQGVYILDGDLFSRDDAWNITPGIIVWYCGSYTGANDTYTFSKNDFYFSTGKYGKLAKLYTYPYSYLEVTDFRGNTHTIQIEDCKGTLKIEQMANIAAPFMSFQAALLGVGGGSRKNIAFKQLVNLAYISEGREYLYAWEWPIPCYAVSQQPSIDYDIHTMHDRAQRLEENATAQTNAIASNTVANSNALDINSAAYTNQDNNINRIKANVADQQTLETATKNRNNQLIDDETTINLAKLSADSLADILCSLAITGAENEATSVTASHNQAMGIAGNVATGALAGATAGSVVPGAGTVAGAVVGGLGGAISGLVGAESIGFNSMVSITTNEDIAEATRNATRTKAQAAATHADASRDLRKNYNTATNALLQEKVSEIAVRNRDTDKAANTLSKTTGDANANRTYTVGNAIANRNKRTADNAVTRAIAQAALNPPNTYGLFENGKDAAIKPMGLEFNIVSQNESDIALAGEAFLRYGYYINRWFYFNGFNYGSKFTYWKCFDINTGAIKLPDAFVDRIKNLLLGGITVYSSPEYIETATLYNNGF